MLFMDSSALIAFFRSEDESHQSSVKIMKNLEEDAIITDLILAEVLTFIKKRDGIKRTEEIWEIIKQSQIKLVGDYDLSKTLDYLFKYDQISFADAASVALMKELKITRIISFDSDFDLVSDIERIF